MKVVNFYKPYFSLNMELAASEKDGIKGVLQMALELDSKLGIKTGEWVSRCPGIGKGPHSSYFEMSYEDAEKVIAGRRSEEEYMTKHRVREEGEA